MAFGPCPTCGASSRVLTSINKDARVLSVRCTKCGHAWTIEKTEGLDQPRQTTEEESRTDQSNGKRG